MIPFLTDLPSAPGLLNAGGALPQAASVPERTGLDFAGLLDTVLPPARPSTTMILPAPALPASQVSSLPPPGAGRGEADLATVSLAPSSLPHAPLTPLVPGAATGKIVPEQGASLPPAVPDVAAAAAADPDLPQVIAGLPRTGTARALAVSGEGQTAEPAAPEIPVDDAGAEGPALIVPVTGIVTPAEPATTSDSAEPVAPAREPQPQPQPDSVAPDPALVIALAPGPTLQPAPPPAQGEGRTQTRLHRGAMVPPMAREAAPMPARVTLPPAPADNLSNSAPEPQLAAPAPASPFTPAAATPAAEAAPQPAPAQALATPPAPPVAPAPDRIEAPRTPAPQQETAIAQVGDLREALRSARPEMTLRHAEFGFVSLRLEQPAPEQWRAVLASRDPSFVPAIQAALAERAVAAASASASASGGADSGNFPGQNGTSDQRYGASPNGGQGGLSPYLGQSAHRDGEAAPDHRRPSTAAALAARGEDGEEASGSHTGTTRGMFA